MKDQEESHEGGTVIKRRLRPTPATLLAEREGPLPVWIRAPKIGPEYFTGLTRSKLYDGASKGYFKSVSLREPGCIHGCRLWHLESVLAWIEKKAFDQNNLPIENNEPA